MSKLAKRLIAKEKEERSGKLDLGKCGLTDLEKQIPELFDCTWLEELILSNSWWDTEERKWIDSQNKVQKNIIAALPLALSKLNNLKSFKCGGDSSRFFRISDISVLQNLTNLNSLDISDNKIQDASFLQNLTNLNSLDISNNQIQDASFLQKLTNLNSLHISDNQIQDASFLQKLINLNSLNINSNKISDLTPFLPLIKKGIPITLNLFGSGLNLFNNPITTPPIEIVDQGNEAVLDWFSALEENKDKPIHYLKEIKILLVGEGLAGKTSLLKKLKGLPFDKQESQTHGVNVEILKMNELKGFRDFESLAEVKVRIWDFGGQEIMHASHQFFLTHRSVYIFVLDSRTDNKKDYWLRHIRKFGGESPAIVAINKIDENKGYSLEEYTLNTRYPFVGNRFIKISCKSGEGIDKLQRTLAELIPETSMFKTPITEKWLNIKNQLEKETAEQRYLNRKRFLEICEEYKENDSSRQNTLLRYLNSLGVILHFPNLSLQEFFVLDPHWVTIGVYKIINSPTIENGILQESELDYILNQEEQKKEEYDPNKEKKIFYEPAEQLYLISIMKEFELLYEYQKGAYLIPDLLPKELDRPVEFDKTNAVEFIIEYDFLPPNVMSRFMIHMQEDIHDLQKIWRTGVVLSSENCNCSALVTADMDKQRISIAVNGEERRKREYFSIIRNQLIKINKQFQDLEIIEKMPVPGHPQVEIEYTELLGYEKAGRDEYFSGKLGKLFSVSADFLDKVTTKREREEERKALEIKINIDNSEHREQLGRMENMLQEIQNDTSKLVKTLDKNFKNELAEVRNHLANQDFMDAKIELLLLQVEQNITKAITELPRENEWRKAWENNQREENKPMKIEPKAKLELTIPFIPGILSYKTELGTDFTGSPREKLFQLWQDLKSGRAFREGN